MKEKNNVDRAVKLNRAMVIVLIIVAFLVAINSSDKTTIDVKLQGVTIDLGQSSVYETNDLEFIGTMEKKLLKPIYFKGEIMIDGEIFTCKGFDKKNLRIVKIDGNSVYDYATLYIDEHFSEVMLVLKGENNGNKTVIVAPAYNALDATALAHKILSDHEER